MNPKDICGAAKPNLSVVPFAPLMEVIAAISEGRRKYGPWNWRDQKVSETIYCDAAIRHLMQFISGEDIDPESGVHHISKAIAGLIIVRDAQLHGCSIDDRTVKQDLRIKEVMRTMADKPPSQNLNTTRTAIIKETKCGGGDYVISAIDIGRKVKLRDGRIERIRRVSGQRNVAWPVAVGPYFSHTKFGQHSAQANKPGEFAEDCEESKDIVGVFITDE